MNLEPVDHDPFGEAPSLAPVDHDPFGDAGATWADQMRERVQALGNGGMGFDYGAVRQQKYPDALPFGQALAAAGNRMVENARSAPQRFADMAEQNAPTIDAAGNPHPPAEVDWSNPLLSMYMPGSIRAYHGSPHSFDSFDLSKVGTGEGAQAYGHGLYFAEAEPVAQQYRDQMRWRGANYDDPQILAQNAIDRHQGDRAAAADNLQSSLDSVVKFYGGKVPPQQVGANAKTQQAIALLRGNGPITGAPPVAGSMYEVALHADPASLLDWDRQLGQQSPQVRGAIKEINQWQRGLPKEVLPGMEPTGAHVYSWLVDKVAPPTGFMRGNPEGQAFASGELRDAGVPGIQYLDQHSRAAGAGSRNYVMFDPSIIEILRKYSLAGLAAGGAAAMGATQASAQPGMLSPYYPGAAQ